MDNSRKAKALNLIQSGFVKQHTHNRFSVNHKTVIHWGDGDWRCECPDFKVRGHRLNTCKHILAAKVWKVLNGDD